MVAANAVQPRDNLDFSPLVVSYSPAHGSAANSNKPIKWPDPLNVFPLLARNRKGVALSGPVWTDCFRREHTIGIEACSGSR